MKIICFIITAGMLLMSCHKNASSANPVTFGDSTVNVVLSTNKAMYAPGEPVSFTISTMVPGSFVRYRHLGEVLKEEALTTTGWNWQPPGTDFTGYHVEVFKRTGTVEKTLTGIAVDVSSNWNRFPRYGFLSDFGQKTIPQMDEVITSLNRYHINGLQFYDWQEKHHKPLAGTVASPDAAWKDIASRDCYKATIQGYITKAHQAGMQAMFYNLCYGVLSDAAADGVQAQWYMYKDLTHTQKDVFTLPNPPFRSNIFFLDPSNTAWQQYLSDRNKDVYQVFGFDGFHIDQVGDRNTTLYNYNGNVINLANSFQPFITAMKAADPAKKLVMNAVNQYGQQGSIANSPVDFLYTEVWTGNEGYKDLAGIIQNNTAYSGGKATVLAAYLNYNKASNPGFFNTPGVLLAEAVIFSFGGSHIELGEHMLGKEYFPNSNLQMNDELKQSIIHYYDFLTAYENLLRDGGTFNSVSVNCTNGKMNTGAWPPQSGKVAVQGKSIGAKQVVHFINLANAANFDWRDTDGTQRLPNTISSADMEVGFTGTATKVWMASPDRNAGVPQLLPFTQTGSTVTFTLPELKYWDMVVIE